MGMGSYNNHSKGNGNGNGGSGSGSGGGSGGSRVNGKPYGLMLVLAFGAALLGLLLLHKLRERRIYNLLLKERDSDLLSLHHFLQKERDYTKELRRKNEEIKAKLYPIRTQKMELDRRISELKSTIGSLKEELQTVEAALEEKQSEIKVLRLRVNTDSGNPQVMELLESLKRKEAEIEDLKHQVEDPVKVRSVSTDDPSNPLVNLTVSDSVSGKEKTEVTEKKEEADRLQESTGNKDIAEQIPGDGNGNKAIGQEDQIGNGERETNRRGTNGGTEEDETITSTTGKDGGFVTGATETNLASEAETINNTAGKEVDHKINDGEESKITRNGHVGNIENSELGEKQKLYATPKGRNRRKKWRLVARDRRLENRGSFENDGVGSVRSRTFFKEDQLGLMGREEETGSNRKLTGDHLINSSDVKVLELQNSENTEELKNKLARVNTSEANGKFFDGVTHNDTKQKVEVGKSEEHEARNIQQQNLNSREAKKLEDSDEEVNAADLQDLQGDLEVADAEEQEIDATDDNIFDESGSSMEENEEEYREEIDESEF